ncbi:uncharacterized protein [Euwallacea fornicatus]|uniref:uncharacterized protein n=1 Tax=Euwallacea fornicatus TaxID=995702 RepID=UPI00338DF94B
MYPSPFYILLSVHIFSIKAEIEILSRGIDYVKDDDIAMIFYVNVKNVGKNDLEIAVNMLHCCETITPDEENCNSMTLIGSNIRILPSNSVKNLTLIYPNLYLFNRRGICSVRIIYRNRHKKREVSTAIHFDTTKFHSGYAKGKKLQCETVDLNFREKCNPVDCLIKYSGTMSYFNPESRRCEKVPVCYSKICDGCTPGVVYSPYSNECVDLNAPISRKDLENIENKQGRQQTSMINAICHYGRVTERKKCLCNEDWTTSASDEGMYEPGVAQHHLCNIQIGDWNCVNKTRIRITMILIVLLAITVISKLLLLMCIMTWCYRHFKKPEKTSPLQLDPEIKSIILSENLDSLDKCLCHELQYQKGEMRQKDSNLQSETVNLKYYPCSPSAFSNIRTSSGSTRCSSKTLPNIDMSNTSTSDTISFPQGDSSEDDDNNDREMFLDDDVSN